MVWQWRPQQRVIYGQRRVFVEGHRFKGPSSTAYRSGSHAFLLCLIVEVLAYCPSIIVRLLLPSHSSILITKLVVCYTFSLWLRLHISLTYKKAVQLTPARSRWKRIRKTSWQWWPFSVVSCDGILSYTFGCSKLDNRRDRLSTLFTTGALDDPEIVGQCDVIRKSCSDSVLSMFVLRRSTKIDWDSLQSAKQPFIGYSFLPGVFQGCHLYGLPSITAPVPARYFSFLVVIWCGIRGIYTCRRRVVGLTDALPMTRRQRVLLPRRPTPRLLLCFIWTTFSSGIERSGLGPTCLFHLFLVFWRMAIIPMWTCFYQVLRSSYFL